MFGGEEDLVATTPLGKVRGYRSKSRSGREFIAFSGLPYAQPPVGDLMFQAPVPVKPWAGVKDALEDGPWCIQYNMFQLKPKPIGELDCLYLSLYTHNVLSSKFVSKVSGSFPVLVRFHGGGFLSGNGPRKMGPEYFMDEDILVVMVNYRVGIYGFLSFEDEEMAGNQGMKDQVMALRWVQENIASFGGDPCRVTIIGDSAGSASVYHHIVSPLTQGLFHKAIAESGTSYNNWAVAAPGEAKKYSLKLVAKLGLEHVTSTKEAVEYLKKMDPNDVVSGLEFLREWQIDPICTFKPVFEAEGPDAFLVWPISKWVHKPVPLLMGMTSGEGLFRTEYFSLMKMDYHYYSENFEKLAPMSLTYEMTSSDPTNVTSALRKHYFQDGAISESDWINLSNLYTDGIFSIGIIDGANKHTGKVFFYYFDYLGEFSFNGHRDKRDPFRHFGACHTDETIYLFKQKCPRDLSDLKGEDLELSKNLVKIWTDFVKYGCPAEGNSLKWDEWTSDEHRFMNISKEGFQMKEGLIEDRYKLWKNTPFRDLVDICLSKI